MRFDGRIKKDGRFWLVEIPAFDAVTQSRTKREAYAMAEDLIETMANAKGFRVTAFPMGGSPRQTTRRAWQEVAFKRRSAILTTLR